MSEDEAEPVKNALSDLRQWAETGNVPATMADCEGLGRLAAESLVGYEKLPDSRRLVLLREAIRRVVAAAQVYVLRSVLSDEMTPQNEFCRVAAADDILDLHVSTRSSDLLRKRGVTEEALKRLRRKRGNNGPKNERFLRASMWLGRCSAQTGRRCMDKIVKSLLAALGHYLASPEARKDLVMFLTEVPVEPPPPAKPAAASTPSSATRETAAQQSAEVLAHVPAAPDALPPMKRRPWLIPAAVSAVAVILGAATAVVFNLANSGGSPTEPPAEPLLVNASWPLGRGCDAATTVAMLPGKAEVGSFAASKDPRRDIAAVDGAGVWITGHLYLNLVGVDGTPVQINNIKPDGLPTPIPAPAWTLGVEGGCGDSYERVFRLDLDRPFIEDVGVQGTADAATATPRTEPLGPAFTVTDREPALVRVDAFACKGNYEWRLRIEYSHNGKSGSQTVGPYRTMARADNTNSYTQRQVEGETRIVNNGPLSGTPQGWPC